MASITSITNSIKTPVNKKTALIAAAGIALLSSFAGTAINDYNSATNINQEIMDLKTALSNNGVSDGDIFATEQTINEGVANNTKWYDSMTKKASTRLIAWEDIIRQWVMNNAYRRGTEDMEKAMSGCLPGLQRIPNHTPVQNKSIDTRI